MVKGRRRDFDLPALGRVAVLGDDAAQQFELDGAERRLVLFGETAAPGDERPDPFVTFEVIRIDPGKLVPHLQVAQVFGREVCRLGTRLRPTPFDWRLASSSA
jgi:hypothetical protein